jgi:uncharacterized protein
MRGCLSRVASPLPIAARTSYVEGNIKGPAVFSTVTNGISRQINGAGAAVSGIFFDPVLRLGVTGLSRAGKTVFITGLVANLLDRGRMPQLRAEAEQRIDTVYLQPQPDDTLPRFAYEDHLAALTGDDPRWPASTRAVSELRLSFRVQPAGFVGALTGPRVLHVDIVDYPGEWLLDLALLDKSYAEWSEATLDRIAKRAEALDFLATARAEDGALALDEPRALALAGSFTAYLHSARANGWSDCTPGRVWMPPVLQVDFSTFRLGFNRSCVRPQNCGLYDATGQYAVRKTGPTSVQRAVTLEPRAWVFLS